MLPLVLLLNSTACILFFKACCPADDAYKGNDEHGEDSIYNYPNVENLGLALAPKRITIGDNARGKTGKYKSC
jgi:hypothetical protein